MNRVVFGRRVSVLSKVALLSVSYIALGMLAGAERANAQSAPPAQPAAAGTNAALPTINVTAPKPKPAQKRRKNTQGVAGEAAPPPTPPAPNTQEARTGTVGVYANSTSVATKSNTPLLNIPQSMNVLTKSFIQDQNFQGLTDVTRYTPGVAIHQGEGNRDELVIRGVDSSANFFVNGFRDDIQYFRDLYNIQSIEVLKGPSALIFGRGAGGGLVNRTTKEADGTRVREMTFQTGSYGDRRTTLDIGDAFSPNVAMRLNAMYESSDTFRDYGYLDRWAINPTMTLKPTEDTTVKLSYEYTHDRRYSDRGNPSQALAATPATRGNPGSPFVSNWSTIFGSKDYNWAKSDVQIATAVIEHDFGHGFSVRNGTVYSSYERMYSNVYPGGGTLAGAVNVADTAVSLAAYRNRTNRENLFNQTDFTLKRATGSVLHTATFGTEFGVQRSLALRDTGSFPTGTNTVVNPFNPEYFGQVFFNHNSASDANSVSKLNISSAYVQDQIDVTRWLQFIAGVRYDYYGLNAIDQNTGIIRGRTDEKVSPRAAIILKPVENVSIYGSYSVSYLPSSGDQFTALSATTLVQEPQKFENTEVGVKWNIQPKLQFTAAVYNLDRTNVPITDPAGTGLVFPGGAHKIRGFETGLNGYITQDWQSSLGYAYTDARIAKDLNALTGIVAGNRVQLVPFNQFSFWNKYNINPVWATALGVIYFSDSFASSDDSVKLPGFVRFDAALYAKINETWKLQLNVENILDKGYWASADGNNNISPGQPRTFKLMAIAKF